MPRGYMTVRRIPTLTEEGIEEGMTDGGGHEEEGESEDEDEDGEGTRVAERVIGTKRRKGGRNAASSSELVQ